MIDHIGFAVSDYARSRAFYVQAQADRAEQQLIVRIGQQLADSGW